MSTLGRWADEGATTEELRLIEASRRERPNPDSRMRTLLALDVGGSSHGLPPSGRVLPRWRGWTTTKIAIMAVCGGGAIAGSAWFAFARHPSASIERPSASAAIAPRIASSPTTGPMARGPVAPASDDPVVGPPTGDAERPPGVPRRHSIRPISSPPPRPSERTDVTDAPIAATTSPPEKTDLPDSPVVSTLSAEVAALERAHTALALHDPASALRALDQYRATYPDGKLSAEEIVLRVQALVARGDQQGARAVADRFFAAHPDSSYARRVRDLLHDPGGSDKKK